MLKSWLSLVTVVHHVLLPFILSWSLASLDKLEGWNLLFVCVIAVYMIQCLCCRFFVKLLYHLIGWCLMKTIDPMNVHPLQMWISLTLIYWLLILIFVINSNSDNRTALLLYWKCFLWWFSKSPSWLEFEMDFLWLWLEDAQRIYLFLPYSEIYVPWMDQRSLNTSIFEHFCFILILWYSRCALCFLILAIDCLQASGGAQKKWRIWNICCINEGFRIFKFLFLNRFSIRLCTCNDGWFVFPICPT